MKYVVGLGNPGDIYEQTRHNAGRISVHDIVERCGFSGWSMNKHANALQSSGVFAGVPIEFFVPETFMNRSGETVKFIVEKLNATPENVIVIHDDVDLPLGEVKVSRGRGSGGNNGIESIIKALKTKDFIRIRVGISPTSFWTKKVKRPTGGAALEAFVLKRFTASELKQFEEVKPKIERALELIVTEGVEKAMNECN